MSSSDFMGYDVAILIQSGSGTSTVVICAPGSKATSVASISSAPTFNDSISSRFVRSCALTPGRSISHPIHQSLFF